MKSIKSCLGSLVSIVLLVLAAYAGWRWGDPVFPRLEAWAGVERRVEGAPAPSRDVADAAAARYARLVETGGPGEVRFDAEELTSLLVYSAAEGMPRGVHDPQVQLDGDRATLSARVDLGAVPEMPDLEELLSFLPDTVDVSLSGALIPFDGSGAALMVDRVSAGGLRLPRRVIAPLLGALGRTDVAGLPDEAIQVRLPDGIRSAYVEDSRLVLIGGS